LAGINEMLASLKTEERELLVDYSPAQEEH
jgi:hypothetical protein